MCGRAVGLNPLDWQSDDESGLSIRLSGPEQNIFVTGWRGDVGNKGGQNQVSLLTLSIYIRLS